MGKRQPIVALFLILSMAACGDVRDTADSVDEAVRLLQDIEQNGTWEFVSDGLDALEGTNYEAAVQLREGGEDITVNLQVDADNDTLAEVITTDGTQDYFVDGGLGQVYRIEQGRYACVTQESDLIDASARSVFEEYSRIAPGVLLSSTADEADDETVAGREAARYELESKLPDALDVLEKLDNDALRASVDEAGTFELTGDLVLDDETGSLLRFGSTYHDVKSGFEAALTFEVTQWDDVPDIAKPADSEITSPCEDGEALHPMMQGSD